jgi:hypothetical protein
MADKIVSWGGIDSKGTTGMGVTGSLAVSGSATITNGATVYNNIVINTSNVPALDLYDSLQNYNWRIFTNGASFFIRDDGGNNAFSITTSRNITIGPGTSNAARLTVKGSGATSSTTAFLVQNSNASASFTVRDDRSAIFAKELYIDGDLGDGTGSIFLKNSAGDYSNRIGTNAYNTFISTRGTANGIQFLFGIGSGRALNFTGGDPNNITIQPAGASLSINGVNDIVHGSDKIAIESRNYNGGEGVIITRGRSTNLTDPIVTFKYETAEKVRINNNGSVGIGTSTPSASLHISGSSGSVLLEVDSNSQQNILYVSGSGNIGIGTGAPTTVLDVRSAAASTGVDKYTGFTTRIQNTKDGDSVNAVLLLVNQNGGNGGYYIRGLNNQQGQERFYVNGNGGIYSISNGTFAGNVQATQIRWNTDSDGWIGDGGLDGTFMVVTNGIERYRINSSGNLLLGTTTNSARLTIQGSGATSSTTSLLVQNANTSASLSVRDDQSIIINGSSSMTIPNSGSALTITRTGNYSNVGTKPILNILDDTGGANVAKGGIYVSITGASNNRAIEAYGGVGFGITPSDNQFQVAYPTQITNTVTAVSSNNNYVLTLKSLTSFATNAGTGISFWGDDRGQGTAVSAFAGIRGVKENSSYLNSLGNLVFYVQTGSAGGLTETTYREAARFNSSGSFGIGTSTPAASLHISGASSNVLLEIDSPAVNNILFVSGSGNVGINTASPTTPLFVKGRGNSSSTTALIVENSNSGSSFSVRDDGVVRILGANTDAQITFTPSGGTSQINLNSQSVTGVMQTATAGTYAGLGLLTSTQGQNTNLGTSLSGAGGGVRYWASLNGSQHSHIFYHNLAEQMRLSYTGNLIVGISGSDTSRLSVRGSGTTSATTALLVQNANASSSLVVLDNNYVGIGKSPSYPLDVAITNGGNASSGMFVSGVHPDGRAILYGTANTNTQQMLYWWHSGGIGVGTGGSARGGAVSYIGDTSYYGPAHGMHFMETGTTFGPANVKSRLSIQTTTTDTALFSQVSNNSTNIESNTFSFTAKSHTFYTGTTTGNQSYPNQFTPLHLSTSGSVGINTITPSATLDVSGSGRFTSNVTITGSLTVSGSITATVPTTSSYVCDGILNSNQTFATGSDAVIQFVDYIDPNNWISGSRFTPTIAGYYNLSFGAWVQNPGVSTNQVNVQMRKNNSTMIICQQPLNNGTGISLGGSRIIQMNGTTDYIDFTVFQGTVDSGTTGTLLQGSANGQGTWFSAFLLTR